MLISNPIFADGSPNPLKDGISRKDTVATACGREVISQQWWAYSTSVITAYSV
jgi:hypothetical protein